MTLRWVDSFDHYSTADISLKYDQGSPTEAATDGNSIQSSTARFTNAMLFHRSNSTPGATDYVGKVITGLSHSTIIFGFAFNWNSFTTADRQVFALREGTTHHISVRFNSSNQLYFFSSGPAAQVGSASSALNADTWYYIEGKVVISDASGSVEWRVNGTSGGSTGSLDTRNGGSGVVTAIQLGFQQSVAVAGVDIYHMDDLYVCDGGGSVNNDFLGDTRIQARFPNGNGNYSQLVGSDGNSTDNYLLVDETTPNTADYVESNVAGDKDTYTYSDLTPTAGTVHGVMVVPYSVKTDAGTRTVTPTSRLSGTDNDGSAATLSTTGLYVPSGVFETKPGGGAWSISDVNSAEFGVKVG